MKKHNKIKQLLIYCPVLEYGGIATTLVNISNYLANYFEIKIFSNSINKQTALSLKSNIKIVDIKKNHIIKYRSLNSLFVINELRKHITKKSIIFSLQDHIPILILNKILFRKKILIRTSSVILNKKNKFEYNNFKNKKLKILSTYFYRLANIIITYSKANVLTLNSRGVRNVYCIYNHYKKNKIYKTNKKKKFNIFFIGRFSFEKDPIFFLKNTLNIKNVNIHLVADGGLKKILKKISKTSKNVFFHGYVTNPFQKFRSKINLLCITSKYEGTPNVLGEAMSYKIPVLAPKNVGLVNFFLKNGKYGYLYKPGNNYSFQNQTNYIIKNYTEALKKSNLGYKSLNRFSEKNTLDKLRVLINRLY